MISIRKEAIIAIIKIIKKFIVSIIIEFRNRIYKLFYSNSN